MPHNSQSPISGVDHLRRIVEQGGPNPDEYEYLRSLFGTFPKAESIPDFLEGIFQVSSLQGFVANQPYGYHGDFAIIDAIYSRSVSACPKVEKWDAFFQALPACEAVRNRRQFLVSWLERNCSDVDTNQILSVASGPCREVQDFFQRNPDKDTYFTCLDQDANAIAFASALLYPWREKIRFVKSNVFSNFPESGFEIIYSSGLFDYLNDRQARLLLKKLWKKLNPKGRMVIGNFSPTNPSRAYMEFGDWNLIHRTRDELISLVREALPEATDINCDAEPLGINLFVEFGKG